MSAKLAAVVVWRWFEFNAGKLATTNQLPLYNI